MVICLIILLLYIMVIQMFLNIIRAGNERVLKARLADARFSGTKI